MDLAPGTVIAGRYRVDQKVGSGGMGEVWSGEHIAIGVRVAVKTLLKAAAMNHEVVARFKREAYFLGRIRSDHVARVVDFVADEDFGLVLVMDFVEGDALARVLMDRQITVEEGVELACDVVDALCDLHKAKIVHRDLKPGNIILEPLTEGRRRAVVVDFGVSRLVSEGKDEDTITGITKADMAVGTIEYMAPEQILNSRDVTGSSDLYALGAILFRGLAGRHVFGATSSDSELAQKKLTHDAPALPISRNDALAKGLKKVVANALKRRPSERYKDAEAMLRDLVPLRDQVRLARLQSPKRANELADDTTTNDGDLEGLETARDAIASKKRESLPASETSARPSFIPHPAPSSPGSGRPSVPSAPPSPSRDAMAAPIIEDEATASRDSANERRRSSGSSAALLFVALLFAAAIGAGVYFRHHLEPLLALVGRAPVAMPSASASASASSAAPIASASAAATTSASAAEPAPTASELTFDDLDPAPVPPANHPPRAPRAPVTASASASASAAPIAAPTATSAPSAKPSSSPSSTPSTTPAPSVKASAAP